MTRALARYIISAAPAVSKEARKLHRGLRRLRILNTSSPIICGENEITLLWQSARIIINISKRNVGARRESDVAAEML